MECRNVATNYMTHSSTWEAKRFLSLSSNVQHFTGNGGSLLLYPKSILSFQIIQPTRCNSFTSLLLDVYVWLNMFRASPSPSSGAYNCTRRLWFYCWREADHDQQGSSCFSPTVKPESPSAVVCSWWWTGRRPKHVEPHINVK